MIEIEKMRKIVEERYSEFISEVKSTKTMWGLKNKEDEWGMTKSDNFKNKEIIVFWSNKKEAEIQSQNDWEGYKVIPVSEDEFIETWVFDDDNEDILIGVNLIRYDENNLLGTALKPFKIYTDTMFNFGLKKF